MRRRDFCTLLGTAPALIAADSTRPQANWGVQVGDVIPGRAMLWSRADRASRMIVDWSTTESFKDAKRIEGPHVLDVSDFTGHVDLLGLPAGQDIFARVSFRSLADGKTLSEPVMARFRTVPAGPRNVRFLWSGDTVGQGFGINTDWGGMKIYDAMRRRQADFFIHSGDTIYADGPLKSEVALPNGEIWRNVVTEAKSKVAETLADFRGNYLYNLLDANVRAFAAETPQIWQWDDHEVVNNWSSSKDLASDPRYREKSIHALRANATRAFLEYAPMRHPREESERVYRKITYGPNLDVFVVDLRSYRGPNNHNRQTVESAETAFFGDAQLAWLLAGLKDSPALWKVIACDMPIGLMVGDTKDAEGNPTFENSANGPGAPLGRELEIARLLRGLKQNKVRNIVWLTADVHYTAAHRYNPSKAKFTDFDPFWEFVSGPLNAGTFGPNDLDETFGPEVVFQKAPPKGQGGIGPSAGMQFFGEVEIAGTSGQMKVTLRDLAGTALHTQTTDPQR